MDTVEGAKSYGERSGGGQRGKCKNRVLIHVRYYTVGKGIKGILQDC